MTSRRAFLQKSILAGVGLSVLGKTALSAEENFTSQTQVEGTQTYTLPPLPYGYDALEPWIDMKTMQVHHDKHHQAYVDNLNKALATIKDAPATLEATLKTVSTQPVAVRNNGGGHWNHTFFWEIMKPAATAGSPNVPAGKLAEGINSAFGSFEKFKEQFTKSAKERFGSGWAWLVLKDGNLVITSTPNQDNPLMDVAEVQGKPILGLDVWEHAYYLKYQNVRADYISNWWNIVNWEKASEHYGK